MRKKRYRVKIMAFKAMTRGTDWVDVYKLYIKPYHMLENFYDSGFSSSVTSKTPASSYRKMYREPKEFWLVSPVQAQMWEDWPVISHKQARWPFFLLRFSKQTLVGNI